MTFALLACGRSETPGQDNGVQVEEMPVGTTGPTVSATKVTDSNLRPTRETTDARTAQVIVWPQDPMLKPGDVFTLKVWVVPGSAGISSGELELGFDPLHFHVDRIKAGDILGPEPIVAINEVDTSTGIARLALARMGETEAPPQEGTFATVKISARSNAPDGNYQLTLNVRLADQNFKAAPVRGATSSRITVSARLPAAVVTTKNDSEGDRTGSGDDRGSDTYGSAEARSLVCDEQVLVGVPRSVEASDGSMSDRVTVSWKSPMLTHEYALEGRGHPVLDIDQNSGTMHAAYIGNTIPSPINLIHAWKEPGECWETEIIETFTETGDVSAGGPDYLVNYLIGAGSQGIEIIYRSGIVHVFYADYRDGTIKHARKLSNGQWEIAVAATGISTPYRLAADVDSACGWVQLVYRGLDGTLKYLRKPSTGANWQSFDIATNSSSWFDLTVGDGCTLHLVYQETTAGSTTSDLQHAWLTTGSIPFAFNVETIASGDYAFPTVAYESTTWPSYLIVSYWDSDALSYLVSWKNLTPGAQNSSWITDTVQQFSSSTNCYITGLSAIGQGGLTIHIAYKSPDAPNPIIYAWKDSQTTLWEYETIEPAAGNAYSDGYCPMIAEDLGENPHIVYLDSDLNFKHAEPSLQNDFSVWKRETVGGEGSGIWTSLGPVTGFAFDDQSVLPNVVYEYGVASQSGSQTGPIGTDTGYAANPEWVIESVDGSDSDAGKYASMVSAGDGLHITYQEDGNTLKYLFYPSTGSMVSAPESLTTGPRVAGVGSNASGRFADIAIRPHMPLSSAERVLHITHHCSIGDDPAHFWRSLTGGPWNSSPEFTCNDGIPSQLYPSIAVGHDGVPHSAAFDNAETNLYHISASLNSLDGSWSWSEPIVVDPERDTGELSSSVIAKDGTIHIAYQSNTSGIKHAQGTLNQQQSQWEWSISNVDPSGDTGAQPVGAEHCRPSIALDSQGEPHVLYCVSPDLWHASGSWNGSSWTWDLQTVDEGRNSSNRVGYYPSIVWSSSTGLHASYHDGDNESLKYANGSEGGDSPWTWSTETVDASQGMITGTNTSIAVHDDSVYIVYYDESNGDLKLAHRSLP